MTNNDDYVVVDVDATYHFKIEEKIAYKYTISQQISAWIQKNIEELTDDDDKKLFSRVSKGFNEDALKTFGNQPVCDVYIKNTDYDDTFDVTHPEQVNTIVLLYLKGASDKSYMNACAVHDYIMQEFIENENFKSLDGIVSDTRITNSELRIQRIRKKWGVIVAFELSHQLF